MCIFFPNHFLLVSIDFVFNSIIKKEDFYNIVAIRTRKCTEDQEGYCVTGVACGVRLFIQVKSSSCIFFVIMKLFLY